MDFDLSSTQKMMQAAARTFLTKECPTSRVRRLMATETAFDAELWSAMAYQGWLGITVDEQYGGLGLGAIELAVIAEEMGRAVLPGPFVSHVLATALVGAADHPARERLLPALCDGTQRAALAWLEGEPYWRPDAASLTATKQANGLVLDGVKKLVSDAGSADHLLVTARDGNELILAIVDAKAPGVSIRHTPAMDATRKLYEVRFESAGVGVDGPLARGVAAETALDQAIRLATLAVCAELVGVMSWTLDTAVEYVKTRQQFGRPVGSFQAVQQQCVDMLSYLESARSATYYAAWALASGDAGAGAAVSAAKAYVSDAGREVVNRGVQVHGGIGFTWEHDLQLYYKRAKSNEILFGDATFHRERIAALALV